MAKAFRLTPNIYDKPSISLLELYETRNKTNMEQIKRIAAIEADSNDAGITQTEIYDGNTLRKKIVRLESWSKENKYRSSLMKEKDFIPKMNKSGHKERPTCEDSVNSLGLTGPKLQ